MGKIIKFPTAQCKKGIKVEHFEKQLVTLGYFEALCKIPPGLAEFILANLQICYDAGYLEGKNES